MVKVKFVNPYTFLPLPSHIKREPPQHHSGSSKQPLFSGSFQVEWTLKTPLLLPVKAEEEGWLELINDKRGIVEIPGSSIKGAMRSLHEAAFFGCLSVIDEDFTPVYREAVSGRNRSTRNSGWRVGIVTEVDEEHRPVKIAVTSEDPIWVAANTMRQLYQEHNVDGIDVPKTGDIIRFSDPQIRDRRFRNEIVELPQTASFRHHGNGVLKGLDRTDYVVVVTDGGARGNRHDWYWCCAPLKRTCQELSLTDKAWNNFQMKVEGSEDARRIANGEFEKVRHTPVKRGDECMGERLMQSGEFAKGDAIWVKAQGNGNERKIVDLSYSVFWRRIAVSGDQPLKLGDLLGELSPCDPAGEEGVCFSCSLFGKIGKDHEKYNEAQSYAGHVRFGGLRPANEQLAEGFVISEEQNVKPLLSPRPGNGQFYLKNQHTLDGANRPTNEQAKNGEISSHWDGPNRGKDGPKLAGRKFYWNHDPMREIASHPFFKASGSGTGTLGNDLRKIVLPETDDGHPTKFVSRVSFDQVTLPQLVSLYYLLNIGSGQKIFGVKIPADAVLRLGGGKPLGFGAIKPQVVACNFAKTTDRYSANDEDERNYSPKKIQELFEGSVEQLRKRILVEGSKAKNFEDNLRLLGRVMSLSGLGDDSKFVTYPPNAAWSQYATEKFHETYAFFTATRGAAFSDGWGEWKPLPTLHLSKKQTIEWESTKTNG